MARKRLTKEEKLHIIRSSPESIKMAIDTHQRGVFYYIDNDGNYVVYDLRGKEVKVKTYDSPDNIFAKIY